MTECHHCGGQLLRQQEMGEAAYFKCLQCARMYYPKVAAPAPLLTRVKKASLGEHAMALLATSEARARLRR